MAVILTMRREREEDMGNLGFSGEEDGKGILKYLKGSGE